MQIAQFHEVRFPEDISYGSSGGPGFKTTVIELASGHEQRNIDWSLARATYDASYGVKSREAMEDVLDFFHARRGKAYGFRFKDWMDFSMDRQVIGQVDTDGDVELQIYKRYEPLTAHYYDRPLLKLVPDTVHWWVNGEAQDPIAISTTSGIISATGLLPNAVVEAQCEFDVPVRFNTDEMLVTHDDYELMSWPSIPLVELKPR
jgi:uncharacterized protein (TIGR02217 family)